jgi:hypothetical protein
MSEMTQYEQGYCDGMEHMSSQVQYINDQVARIAQILTKAVFTQPSATPPKPNTHIWLILDNDRITTGYYLGGKYIADSGIEVKPIYWCMIPSIVSGKNDGPLKRIIKD